MVSISSLPPALVPVEAVERVGRDIANKRERARVMEVILAALAPFDGKVCTKRIEKPLQEALPDYRVVYYPPDSMWGSFKVSVWKDAPVNWGKPRTPEVAMPFPYGARMELTIARKESAGMTKGTEGRISLDRIRSDFGRGWLLEAERADEMAAALPGLGEAIADYNVARAKLHSAMSALAPFGYALFPRS